MIILVRHEINRLVAWHDAAGSGRAGLISNMASLKAHPKPSQQPSDASWKTYLALAEVVDPTLLVFIASRYPTVDVVQQRVQQEVRRCPSAFSHVPEAVHFLVTPENVAGNVPELYTLANWAPVSPATALELLRTYSHNDTVVQYALRVLHSFRPDVILFFIPQLVQALRFDRKGFIKAYMLDAAEHSQLLAHQMIWNMKTNVFK